LSANDNFQQGMKIKPLTSVLWSACTNVGVTLTEFQRSIPINLVSHRLLVPLVLCDVTSSLEYGVATSTGLAEREATQYSRWEP
jgi:hypothetical protein